jgi:tetratricopeptide (TPR) repeat protein
VICMPPARRQQVEPLEDDERAMLEAQTRRNLDGIDLEQAGQIDEAVALYEQNVADGFSGDWPYSRLVSIYERGGRYDEAERVVRRAIEVTRADRRKPAPDRRTLIQGLQGRLRLLKKTAQAARQKAKDEAPRGHSFLPLPMLDS